MIDLDADERRPILFTRGDVIVNDDAMRLKVVLTLYCECVTLEGSAISAHTIKLVQQRRTAGLAEGATKPKAGSTLTSEGDFEAASRRDSRAVAASRRDSRAVKEAGRRGHQGY